MMDLWHNARGAAVSRLDTRPLSNYDGRLIGILCTLLGLGLVAMYSASTTLATGLADDSFYYLKRQGSFVLVGLCAAACAMLVPLKLWHRLHIVLLCFGFLGLVMVLIPGLGHEVNGATRWLQLGSISVQASEPFKLAMIAWLAGYLVRHQHHVSAHQLKSLVGPAGVWIIMAGLLLSEPDFGTMVVLSATMLGMLFIGGVSVLHVIYVIATGSAFLVTMMLLSPYRLQRLSSFMDPWAAPHDHSFQLTQSLMAFGRGGWFGEGLGGSLQKLFYLPEAHTDFVFAVLAEELGFLGSTVLILLYLALVWRCLAIAGMAARARHWFGCYMVYGISILMGLQIFVNLGVNVGMLPTKGLALPLVSYGGSSLAISCLMFGIVLRVGYEAAAVVCTADRSRLRLAALPT